MKVVFYRDANREWRWRLKARNGRYLADSGEGYKRKGACAKSWWSVRDNIRGFHVSEEYADD